MDLPSIEQPLRIRIIQIYSYELRCRDTTSQNPTSRPITHKLKELRRHSDILLNIRRRIA